MDGNKERRMMQKILAIARAEKMTIIELTRVLNSLEQEIAAAKWRYCEDRTTDEIMGTV